jgi:transposase
MGRAYSIDLRKRVVAAVETGGLSCHQAAPQFDVGISTAILWVQRFRRTGSVEPGRIGGYKPRKIAGAHRNGSLAKMLLKDRRNCQSFQMDRWRSLGESNSCFRRERATS